MPPNVSSSGGSASGFELDPAFELWGTKGPKLAQVPLSDFLWKSDDEPHRSRRDAILKAHPEIKKLFGPDPKLALYGLLLVALQIAVGVYVSDKLWTWQFWLIVYFIGATTNHAITLAVHEIGHNLAFRNFRLNRWLGFFVQLPLVLPMSITFRDYHNDHHRFQGIFGKDADLPTEFEGWFFSNAFTKLFFCSFQIFFYTLRPMIIRPPRIDFYYWINYAIQFTFDFIIWYFFGWGPLIYMAMSIIVAGSLHPCAGHFLAEHYVFGPEQETFSYYGPLNVVSFNAGYHVEHHDFPYIPFTRIHRVAEIAPEFYNKLYYHKSWTKVLWHFITDSHISPRYRVTRRDKYVAEFIAKHEGAPADSVHLQGLFNTPYDFKKTN